MLLKIALGSDPCPTLSLICSRMTKTKIKKNKNTQIRDKKNLLFQWKHARFIMFAGV